jgi:hypothetical protein
VTYTWNEIRDGWLQDGRIAHSPDEIVEAFNRAERVFGRDWVDAKLTPMPNLSTHGALVTLTVVDWGRLLGCLEDVGNADPLLARLRAGRSDALAELRAISLLRATRADVQVELEPVVTIAGRDRKPDLRVRVGEEPWTYAEVTKPDTSEARERVRAVAVTVCGVVDVVPGEYAVEVFLRREPTDAEVDTLKEHVEEACRLQEVLTLELPSGLGTLFLNQTPPGQVVLDDHGEQYVPRIGVSRALGDAGGARRHIAMRVPFSDSRADDFLRREARQLPPNAPGLVMIDMAEASGGMRTWRPLLRRRLQPNLHTRVGAICLFRAGVYPSDAGESTRIETKVLVNAHATTELPTWLISDLEQTESSESDIHRDPG